MRELVSIVRTSLASLCAGVTIAMPAQAGLVKAIEYAGDHIFLTARPSEIAALDSGAVPGWVRTGVELWVHDSPGPDLVPVCRFYSAAYAPRSSHFYTADASECAAVKGNPDWIYEGTAFYAQMPGRDGSCRDGSMPVQRWYNNGRDGVPNHIYSPWGWSWDADYDYAPVGWIVERPFYDLPAFCMANWWPEPQRRFDVDKARQGREALVLDSVWELVIGSDGPSEARVRIKFDNRILEGEFGGYRRAIVDIVTSQVTLTAVQVWEVRTDERGLVVHPTGKQEEVGPGAYRLYLVLQYVGRDRLEGDACLWRGDVVRCEIPVTGRRM
jgi:hypothetical protein